MVLNQRWLNDYWLFNHNNKIVKRTLFLFWRTFCFLCDKLDMFLGCWSFFLKFYKLYMKQFLIWSVLSRMCFETIILSTIAKPILSPQRSGFNPGAIHLEFILDKVTHWNEYFGFPLPFIIQPVLHIHLSSSLSWVQILIRSFFILDVTEII